MASRPARFEPASTHAPAVAQGWVKWCLFQPLMALVKILRPFHTIASWRILVTGKAARVETCGCNRGSTSIYKGSSILRRPFVCRLLIGLIILLGFRAANPATVSAATIHHYEYVFTAGLISVYDMDNGHSLLKTVAVPTTA